jgi:hypothetical protein
MRRKLSWNRLVVIMPATRQVSGGIVPSIVVLAWVIIKQHDFRENKKYIDFPSLRSLALPLSKRTRIVLKKPTLRFAMNAYLLEYPTSYIEIL